MKTRCVVNKPYSRTQCSNNDENKDHACEVDEFSLEAVMGFQPLSQMSLGKCWMVLAFDFYQTRKNGNIHSLLLKCF